MKVKYPKWIWALLALLLAEIVLIFAAVFLHWELGLWKPVMMFAALLSMLAVIAWELKAGVYHQNKER